MSAASFGRELVRATIDVLYGIVGWLLVAPLAALVPRRRDWIAVIGRGDGKFLDNSKYFFIEAALDASAGLRVVNVTEREDVRGLITSSGLEALRYPSLAACWFLLRCGVVVVDSIEWCKRWRRFLLVRARLVQLWHGVGFKRIELDKWRNEASGRGAMSTGLLYRARMLRKHLRGRVPRYDVVVTTSPFYRDNVFRSAFRARHVITTGYPRNSFGQLSPAAAALAWKNVDSGIEPLIRSWRDLGRKVVLFAPTFRDTRATPLGLNTALLEQLDAFAGRNGLELLFKFHPYEHGNHLVFGRHLHVLHPDSDAYPLLPFVNALVTDYSSIYMDYLLLDRPVFFFTPDLTEYVARDRNLQFDFDRMTPGPKLLTWDDLMAALAQSSDDWKAKRRELAQLAFGNEEREGATSRLLSFLSKFGWLYHPGIQRARREERRKSLIG